MSTATTRKTPRSSSRAASRGSAPSPSYLALIREFPLRAIRDEADYNAASKIIDRLAIRGEDDLDPGETDYLDALCIFFERYEDEHYPIVETGTPLEHLKALLAEAKMNTTDLGKLLGNKSLASLVLNGKRELSKANIRVLAERFKVDASLFL